VHGVNVWWDSDLKPVLAAIASGIAEASDASWEVAVSEVLDQEILASPKTREKIAAKRFACLQRFS